MKRHLASPQEKDTENGERLFRAIDGIDERWIELANDPSVSLARTHSSRKTVRNPAGHMPKRFAVVCAIFLLLLLSVELLSAVAVYRVPLTVSETFAREYTELYGGEMTEEKYKDLLALRDTVSLFLKQHDKINAAARSGRISISEYRTYMERYHYLEARSLSLDRFVEYTAYLQNTEAERGTEVQILYKTSWERFFGRNHLPLLTTALFFAACFLAGFARRYDVSKKQRSTAAILLGAAVALVLCGSDLLLFLILCRPDGLRASIVSFERFSALPVSLTLSGYLTLRLLLTAVLSIAALSLLTAVLVRLPVPSLKSYIPKPTKGEFT